MSKPVSLGRHSRNCSICKHPQRADIEADFIAWRGPISIAAAYALSDRASVYRHAHALNLFARRQRNVKAALEQIIEQAGSVEASAAAVAQAVQAYSKINAQGQWVDRCEQLDLNQLFERMTTAELDRYARDGSLPEWFLPATAPHSRTDGEP